MANHDFQRLLCGPRGQEELRCAWVFLMTQAGSPTICDGEEIGMRFIENSPPKEGSSLERITAPAKRTPAFDLIGCGDRCLEGPANQTVESVFPAKEISKKLLVDTKSWLTY